MLKLGVWLLTVVLCRKWFADHDDQFRSNAALPPTEIARELESGAVVGQPRDQLCDCVNDCGSTPAGPSGAVAEFRGPPWEFPRRLLCWADWEVVRHAGR